MKRILTLLFIVMSVLIAQSQTVDKYSVSGKITMDLLAENIFEGVELNILSNNYICSVGYYFGNDYKSALFGPKPRNIYKQANLLFGKYIDTKNEKFRFQYQGGVGVFWGEIRVDEHRGGKSAFIFTYYPTKKILTVGVPIKIGGRYIPFKFLSIGIDLQTNLNLKKPILRPMLSIEIGKLR